MAQPDPSKRGSRSCPYCEGVGCEECGSTGTRWGGFITTDDGLNISAHGSGDMTKEMEDALVELARAAFAHVDSGTDKSGPRRANDRAHGHRGKDPQ